jgi:hypothetical protein
MMFSISKTFSGVKQKSLVNQRFVSNSYIKLAISIISQIMPPIQ